jgi:hypothetical protein
LDCCCAQAKVPQLSISWLEGQTASEIRPKSGQVWPENFLQGKQRQNIAQSPYFKRLSYIRPSPDKCFWDGRSLIIVTLVALEEMPATFPKQSANNLPL